MEGAMDLGLQLVRVAVALAIVIGLLVITVYGLKRLGGWARKPAANAWIQVMAQHPVGLKHHLVLVQVREQMFLLGVSPQGMHFLSPIHEPIHEPIHKSTGSSPSAENESK